ncbi:MAG TPA: single-stranded DNA-binding protein [Streptosporangiaceae bacterium]
MINDAHISLAGYVATQPTRRATSTGVPSVTMRVAWTPRWMDRATGEWTDGQTSYVSVLCWRKLAENAAVCLRKGDPVVVRGRLSVRPYEDRQGMQRTAVEVDAFSVGHDLSHGVAQFQRVRPATGKTADEHAAELAATGLDASATGSGDDQGSGSDLADGQAADDAGLSDAAGSHGDDAGGEADGTEMFDDDAIAALAGQVAAGAPA